MLRKKQREIRKAICEGGREEGRERERGRESVLVLVIGVEYDSKLIREIQEKGGCAGIYKCCNFRRGKEAGRVLNIWVRV